MSLWDGAPDFYACLVQVGHSLVDFPAFSVRHVSNETLQVQPTPAVIMTWRSAWSSTTGLGDAAVPVAAIVRCA